MMSLNTETQMAIDGIMSETMTKLKSIIGRPVTIVYKIKINDISQDHIIQTVCRICNTTWSDMISKSQKNEVLIPRQICMWVLNKYAGVSLNELAKLFDKCDHTSTMRSVMVVSNMIDTENEKYCEKIKLIEKCLLKLTEE